MHQTPGFHHGAASQTRVGRNLVPIAAASDTPLSLRQPTQSDSGGRHVGDSLRKHGGLIVHNDKKKNEKKNAAWAYHGQRGKLEKRGYVGVYMFSPS